MLTHPAAADDYAGIALMDGSRTDEPGRDRDEVLSEAALQLVRSASEAEIAAAVRLAAAGLIPGRPVQLSSAAPGGWHLLLDEESQDGAVLRLPLRVEGTILGELSVLGAAPLAAVRASTIAELAAHTALALARLEYGRLLSGVTPSSDPDVFAANSFRDLLTNLPSRMLFHDRVEHALHRRSRHVHPVAVMVIDLAGSVTAVREGMGAAAGDRLLVQVAKRLQRLVRSADTLARFDDDRLGALLDDLDSAADAGLVAERLLAALDEPFVLSPGVPLSIQAHVGIAVNGGAVESAVELLEKASRAADAAQRHGVGYESTQGHQRSAPSPRRSPR